jgi:hypothetical protein
MSGVHYFPPCNGSGPFARDLGNRHNPRASVLAALGIVGCRRRHAVRPFFGALSHLAVKR